MNGIKVYIHALLDYDCSIKVYQLFVTVGYKHIYLNLMPLVTHYTQNYSGIISRSYCSVKQVPYYQGI